MEGGCQSDSTFKEQTFLPRVYFPPGEWGGHTDTVSLKELFRCHSQPPLFPLLTMMTNTENAACQHWQGNVYSGTGLWLYNDHEVCVLFFLKPAGGDYGS